MPQQTEIEALSLELVGRYCAQLEWMGGWDSPTTDNPITNYWSWYSSGQPQNLTVTVAEKPHNYRQALLSFHVCFVILGCSRPRANFYLLSTIWFAVSDVFKNFLSSSSQGRILERSHQHLLDVF